MISSTSLFVLSISFSGTCLLLALMLTGTNGKVTRYRCTAGLSTLAASNLRAGIFIPFLVFLVVVSSSPPFLHPIFPLCLSYSWSWRIAGASLLWCTFSCRFFAVSLLSTSFARFRNRFLNECICISLSWFGAKVMSTVLRFLSVFFEKRPIVIAIILFFIASKTSFGSLCIGTSCSPYDNFWQMQVFHIPNS